jgi:hypothetical protein
LALPHWKKEWAIFDHLAENGHHLFQCTTRSLRELEEKIPKSLSSDQTHNVRAGWIIGSGNVQGGTVVRRHAAVLAPHVVRGVFALGADTSK